MSIPMNEAVDVALARVGGYRRWHLFAFVCLGFSSFAGLCWQQLGIVFVAWIPPHHCKLPEGWNVTDHIPLDEKTGKLSQCKMYANISIDNTTTNCLYGWTYDAGPYVSMNVEWDLVCEQDYLGDLSQTFFQIGALVGELFCIFTLDRVGRLKIHLGCLLLYGVMGLILAFVQDYLIFVIIRSFMAIPIYMSTLGGETLMLELFDSSRRTFAGIGLESMWIILYLALGLLGYLAHHWRTFQIVTAAFCFIWFFYIWALPESVFWLVIKERYKDAEAALHKMARWNGLKIRGQILGMGLDGAEEMVPLSMGEDDDMGKLDETKAERINPGRPVDMFTNRTLLKHTLITALTWCANALIYYCLVLGAPLLAGDRFVNFTLGGLVEIPAYILCYYVVKKSRRWTISIFHILVGVFLFPIGFIPDKEALGVTSDALILTCAMAGKFCISISFGSLILFVAELFPTNLRGTGTGIALCAGRIGGITAPMLTYMSRHILWLPNVILAVVSVVVGILILLLPETAGKPLPQTIADVENLYRNIKYFENLKKGEDEEKESERT